jgi:hypothetical protein
MSTRTKKSNASQVENELTNNLTCQPKEANRSYLAALGHDLSKRAWLLNSEKLCTDARRRTGLVDFGDPPLEPALTVLVNSLENEANLQPFGRLLIRMHLLSILEARLQLTKQWRNQSQDTELPTLVRPLFITGMPRSGSTFLHELLAQEPSLRAPRAWEAIFLASATEPDRGWLDRRVWQAAFCLWLFRRLVPQADAVHPMRARTPQECVAIHSYTLLSEEFVATCHVPTYGRFLRSTDLQPAYAWEKRLLQHLQAGQASTRWVLKSPDHVRGLEALFTSFPDARIVQTHRNPLDVLKSLIQLNERLKGLYGRPPNHEQAVNHETQSLAAGIEQAIQFRDNHPELRDRFIDVNYSELVAAPLKVVSRISCRCGIPLSTTASASIHQLARSRSAYKGRKTATPFQPGEGLRTQLSLFKEYCHRFEIPSGLAG